MMKFRTQYMEPAKPVYARFQDEPAEGFVPGAVEPIGILIARLENGNKIQAFRPGIDSGTLEPVYRDEFDLYDELQSEFETPGGSSQEPAKPVEKQEAEANNGVGEEPTP